MSFVGKRNVKGEVVKASIKFGKNKEVCFTPFNGATYVHLADAKHCFVENSHHIDTSGICSSMSFSYKGSEPDVLSSSLVKCLTYLSNGVILNTLVNASESVCTPWL